MKTISDLVSILRSSHTAGRDIFNNFLGNEGYDFVYTGNLLCSRLCLCLIVCFVRGCRWIVEQPEGSSLASHPRFQWILGIGKVAWRVSCHIQFMLRCVCYECCVLAMCSCCASSNYVDPGVFLFVLDGCLQWQNSEAASPLEQ